MERVVGEDGGEVSGRVGEWWTGGLLSIDSPIVIKQLHSAPPAAVADRQARPGFAKRRLPTAEEAD